MGYTLHHIAQIVNATVVGKISNAEITELAFDSRKYIHPPVSLFFALEGANRSGSDFVKQLAEKGQRNFVVTENFDTAPFPADCCFLKVKNVLAALQQLAAYYRMHSAGGTIAGITGSNGKTIVKDWLYFFLHTDVIVHKSPRSFNSQIGVPISIWGIPNNADISFIEAGISTIGEMEKLEEIIRPDAGIFTTIGDAHAEGFKNVEEKIDEKLKLFSNTKMLVYPADEGVLSGKINDFKKNINPHLQLFSWGRAKNATVVVQSLTAKSGSTQIGLVKGDENFSFTIPFTDEASVQNAITCACFLWCVSNINIHHFTNAFENLPAVNMRMELKKGVNGCHIINDSYSADLSSLRMALDFLKNQNTHQHHSIILSDFPQTGLSDDVLYQKIATLLNSYGLYRIIGVGPKSKLHENLFSGFRKKSFYRSTEELLNNFSTENFLNETILIKGARAFGFEKLLSGLEQKLHQTLLEIDLNALRHNLNVYKSMLGAHTGIMAMVKAFSYGSGSVEIATLLQHAGVKYLAVAYTDEGVELRKGGIRLPIMVMNPEEAGFDKLIQHQLEPEIYSFSILKKFGDYLKNTRINSFPIHIKVDTGMHRLGFLPEEIPQLAQELRSSEVVKVASVFSHLAASDNPVFDSFTNEQYELLLQADAELKNQLSYSFLKHISNTSAISRLPHLQLDMVRLGIGLYGVDSNFEVQKNLKPVTTLKTSIAQIKQLPPTQTVGYNRAGKLENASTIATVRIGYADGFRRSFGNGVGAMLVNGKLAPVIGNVCMDMTMLNITGIEAKEGDEVIVFGEKPSVTELAMLAGTIPYEIFTNISERVKRIYYEE